MAAMLFAEEVLKNNECLVSATDCEPVEREREKESERERVREKKEREKDQLNLSLPEERQREKKSQLICVTQGD